VATTVRLTPDIVNYNCGYSLLELITRPIPRGLWPGKRYPMIEALHPIMKQGKLSQRTVATGKGKLLVGPAFTFAGYWYAVGGPLVLMLAGFLTGCFFRVIRMVYDRSPGNEGDIVLYASLVMLGFYEAAATPLVWVFGLPSSLIPLLLAIMYSRVHKQGGK
jgi:hypothetical protein